MHSTHTLLLLTYYNVLQAAITKSLQGHFKEFQCPYKPRQSSAASSDCKGGSGVRSHSIVSTLTVPDGEDSTSFERHNRALKLEYDKLRLNKQVAEELIAQSFVMRWNDLHITSYGLDTVFEKYPFLADVSEVSLNYIHVHVHTRHLPVYTSY